MLPRTRSVSVLLRGPSSLSPYKTSDAALAPPKSTSNVHLESLPSSTTKKRKKKEDHLNPTETDTGACLKRSTKKAKIGFHDDSDVGSTPVTKHKLEKKKRTKGEKDPIPEAVKAGSKSGYKGMGKDKKGKKKQTAEAVVSEKESGGEAVEDNQQSSSLSDSEEGGGEYIPPVHESLARAPGPNSASSSQKGKKYAPPDETPDQRDSRTIFVGNVPSQVMAAKVSWCYVSLPEIFTNRPNLHSHPIAFAQAVQTPHLIFCPRGQNRICPLPFDRLPKANHETALRG